MGKIIDCICIAFLCGYVFAQPEFEDLSKIDPFVFEDLINQTLELLREDLPDSIVIEDQIDLSLTDSLLNGTINITNPEIAGLKGFQATAIKFSIIGMILNITLEFPQIDIKADYAADTILATVLPIYGDGPANIRIDNPTLTISTTFNITNPQLKNFRIQIELDDLQVDIENLLNSSEFSSIVNNILTGLANDLIVPYLDENAQAISEVISPVIMDVINEILASILSPSTTTVDTSSN